MRNIVNLLRKAVNRSDKAYISAFGDELEYWELDYSQKFDDLYYNQTPPKFSYPVKFYGFMEIDPQQSVSAFGIDSPDEGCIDTNYDDILKSIGKLPVIGSRVVEQNGDQWIIIQRALIKSRLWGKYRLKLYCHRYMESTTSQQVKK
jgi:hypothetical protein